MRRRYSAHKSDYSTYPDVELLGRARHVLVRQDQTGNMLQGKTGYVNSAPQLYQEVSGEILERPAGTRLQRVPLYHRSWVIALVV